MDGNRFDDLTRAVASGSSRRSVLRGRIGGAAGALAATRGGGPARAAGAKTVVCHRTTSATNPWETLRVGADELALHRAHPGDAIAPDFATDPNHCGGCGRVCPAGQVCEGSRCRAGCRIGGAFVAPGADRPGNFCQSCQPAVSTADWSPKPNNTGCNDGDACTQTDTCQAGFCVGSNPVDCTASDQCHDIGTCNPATGLCSDPIKPNGTGCNDGNACTQTDTCQNGSCIGANPVVCTASDQCHDAGVCDPRTGVCSNPAKADGAACDDGDACTTTSCQAGFCTVTARVACTPIDQCHDAGVCNPANGTCSNPTKADTTPCTDGNACTTGDQCVGGICRPGTPVDCSSLNTACLEGYCANGACATRPRNEGGACGDPSGDPCNPSFCRSGVCTEEPVVCADLGACQYSFCMGGSCQTVDIDGGSCGPSTECSDQVCSFGSCQTVRANDGQTCGIPTGNACTQRVCRDTSCVVEDIRGGCPGGVCFEGGCCLGGVEGFDPCNPHESGICCATEPCCGGGCCPDRQCMIDEDDGQIFCCGGNGTTICGDTCCASGSANPECVDFNGGKICSRRATVCKADDGVTDVVCNDACCNGRCCPSGTFCTNNGCQATGVACTTNAECQAKGYDNCAGVESEFVFPEGGGEPSLVPVANSGTCCVSGRTASTGNPNPPTGAVDYCCSAGEYACGKSCASYRDKSCMVGDSLCQCSYRITRPR